MKTVNFSPPSIFWLRELLAQNKFQFEDGELELGDRNLNVATPDLHRDDLDSDDEENESPRAAADLASTDGFFASLAIG